MRQTGHYETLGKLKHFTPDSLPPKNPPLALTTDLIELFGEANFTIAQLNEMAHHVPDPARFINAYVMKEALLSSEIEGIHTTLLDAYTQPLHAHKPNKDTQLVLNYTKALNVSLDMITEQKLPIVSRVLLAAHKSLMSIGEGDKASPGEYRKQSVRVGQHIPPLAPKIPTLIADLEKFINEDVNFPPIFKAGLAHVQFETIHPFLDGNGRIGRLLIVLMLIDANTIDSPILYPSYYFKRNQMEYYQRLDAVRIKGDFEGWMRFYLKALIESAKDAYRRAKDIEKLEQKLLSLINTNKQLKTHQDATTCLTLFFRNPVISANKLSEALKKSYNTANKLINLFVDAGVLYEMTMQKRNKLYQFTEYLELLEKEYD